MAQMLHFTERQADAILELKLYRLIGLEIEALNKEYEQTTANIYRYEDILDRRDSMAQVILNELEEMKKEYGRERRTVIENGREAVFEAKKAEEMDVYFLMDRFGYCRTIDEATFERNREAAEAENKYIIKVKNTGKICIFTNLGNLHTFKVMDLPFGKFRDKGLPVDNISTFDSSREEMVCVASQSQLNLYRILFVTKAGLCKVVDGGSFDVAKRLVAATKLNEGDQVVSVMPLTEQKYAVMESKDGYLLKFEISEIPEKQKTAAGVRGMKLGIQDEIIAVHYLRPAEDYEIDLAGRPYALSKLKTMKRDSKGTKPKR